MDYIAIVVLCVGIITSFSGRSYTNVWLQNVGDKLISWLAQFSLSLYLNHYVWINTLQDWKLAIPFWQEVIIFVVLSVLTAITCCVTVNVIQSLFQSRQGNGLRTEIPKQIKEQV